MFQTQYVEIIGLAGSGKTSLKNLLLKYGDEVGDSYQSRELGNLSSFARIRVFFKFLLFLIFHPKSFEWLLARPAAPFGLSPEAKKITRNLKFRVILESVIVRDLLRKYSNLLLNDEGIIGRAVVLSILIQKNIDETQNFLEFLLVDKMKVILIDIDEKDSIRRMCKRGNPLPFWDKMELSLRLSLCEECKNRYESIGVFLSQADQKKVIRVSNRGCEILLNDFARNILKKIKN